MFYKKCPVCKSNHIAAELLMCSCCSARLERDISRTQRRISLKRSYSRSRRQRMYESMAGSLPWVLNDTFDQAELLYGEFRCVVVRTPGNIFYRIEASDRILAVRNSLSSFPAAKASAFRFLARAIEMKPHELADKIKGGGQC